MNPYQGFVSRVALDIRQAKSLPLGALAPVRRTSPDAGAPKVLLFSTHPDDECVTGALPLRFVREAGADVVDVAVTQGSKKERQAERLRELKNACDYLGFRVVQTRENGLEKITPATREKNREIWDPSVEVIRRILTDHKPAMIFTPHVDDWNGSHIGTNLLVVDALGMMDDAFTCLVVETEYWRAMLSPNLMIESSEEEVADLVAATACHAGEVVRNPYHLGLPAWMQDNVRRGSEIIGGQGGQAVDFTFATLYRIRRWRNGGFKEVLPAGRAIACRENVGQCLSL